jgi:hypothetical protein
LPRQKVVGSSPIIRSRKALLDESVPLRSLVHVMLRRFGSFSGPSV